MNEILDIDEGARYVGEFALGVNPVIHHPIGDILFDEKIAGSFHLTPGNSYDNASNGNHSAVHWDLIQIQTPEYGGKNSEAARSGLTMCSSARTAGSCPRSFSA